MYALKPIFDNTNVQIQKPTCMYELKSYHDDKAHQNVGGATKKQSSNSIIESSVSFQSLVKQQESIFSRLAELEKRVDQLLVDSKKNEEEANKRLFNYTHIQEVLNSSKRIDKKSNLNAPVRDIVVQMDPSRVSYSIIVLFSHLCAKYKCFIQFYTHGSAIDEAKKSVDCKKITQLFSLLKYNANESRLNYDYGLSIIWRKFDNQSKGPFLHLDSVRNSKLFGEATILRYINRVIHNNANYDNKSALIDDSIDLCTNEFVNSNDKHKYLTQLDDLVAKSKWLTSNDAPTLADIYVWSVLKQHHYTSNSNNLQKYKNISKWIENFEGSKHYSLFKCFN